MPPCRLPSQSFLIISRTPLFPRIYGRCWITLWGSEMAAFIPPYSRRFTERLARVAAKRETEAREKEKDPALLRHYGAPMVFELWRSTSHSIDITQGHLLLPKKSSSPTAESPQSLIRAMTASLVGEGSVKQPVWRATASSELRSSQRRAASPPPRYWLPSGKSGTTNSHTDEIGDVCSRSPHRRNNRTGRRRLAVERRYKRNERRQTSSCVGAEPCAPMTPNASFSTDRRASLPSTPGGGSSKHLIITVKIASACDSDPERHAILSVSSSCSRRELFRCIASQLQLQLVATRASSANNTGTGTGSGDAAPQSLVADIILYADGYGAQRSCSLATHTLLDPPFCANRGFDTCSRMRIVLKATAQQQQQQQQANEKAVATEPPTPPSLTSPGSGRKPHKKPSPNHSRRPNPFDNPFDDF